MCAVGEPQESKAMKCGDIGKRYAKNTCEMNCIQPNAEGQRPAIAFELGVSKADKDSVSDDAEGSGCAE